MNLRGIDLEIVEQVREPRDTPPGVDVIFPDHVRINGMEVIGPAGSRIDLSTEPGHDGVYATMTLFCRTVRVATEVIELDDDIATPIYDGVKFLFNMDPVQLAHIIRNYTAAARKPSR